MAGTQQQHIPAFMGALPPYLGGKRRLTRLIFAVLHEALPRERWGGLRLLDPMSGGGAVVLHAKALGFHVVASDAALRAVITARALVANSERRLSRRDTDGLFATPVGAARPWRPDGIPSTSADLLARAVANAEVRPEPVRSLLLLIVIRLALRQQPMSVLNASDAVFAATGDLDRISPRRLGHYLRAPAALSPEGAWRVAERVNAGVFAGRGEAGQADALEAITGSDTDVLYLDPPYGGTTGYALPYAVLDDLLGDESAEIAPPTLDALLAAASAIPVVVLSYGGPKTDLAHLTELVSEHRTVRRAIEIPYPHLRSVAREEHSRASREYIVVATR